MMETVKKEVIESGKGLADAVRLEEIQYHL
jgi:hypothetical protein